MLSAVGQRWPSFRYLDCFARFPVYWCLSILYYNEPFRRSPERLDRRKVTPVKSVYLVNVVVKQESLKHRKQNRRRIVLLHATFISLHAAVYKFT